VIYGKPTSRTYQRAPGKIQASKATATPAQQPSTAAAPAPSTATPSGTPGAVPGMYPGTADQPGVGLVPLCSGCRDWTGLMPFAFVAFVGADGPDELVAGGVLVETVTRGMFELVG
jgi:hypothetical protein